MAQDFDIGRQARLDMVANGAVVSSAQVTDFTAKQEVVQLKSRPLGSPPVHKVIPDGWTGSFSADRLGPTWDDWFAREEANYWDNGVDGSQVFLTMTVREKTGAISQYRFEGVVLTLDDAGNYKQDDKVAQKVSFMASRRTKVA